MSELKFTIGGFPESEAWHFGPTELDLEYGRIIGDLQSGDAERMDRGYTRYYAFRRHFMADEWDEKAELLDDYRSSVGRRRVMEIVYAIRDNLIKNKKLVINDEISSLLRKGVSMQRDEFLRHWNAIGEHLSGIGVERAEGGKLAVAASEEVTAAAAETAADSASPAALAELPTTETKAPAAKTEARTTEAKTEARTTEAKTEARTTEAKTPAAGTTTPVAETKAPATTPVAPVAEAKAEPDYRALRLRAGTLLTDAIKNKTPVSGMKAAFRACGGEVLVAKEGSPKKAVPDANLEKFIAMIGEIWAAFERLGGPRILDTLTVTRCGTPERKLAEEAAAALHAQFEEAVALIVLGEEAANG